MASKSTPVDLSQVPDDFTAKYLPYEPTLRQKQRANAFTKGSYIHSLKIFKTDTLLSLSGKVYRSMRKSESPHTINIDVDEDKKQIIDAHCDCKAGSGGKCAHVLAIILMVESWKINGYKAIPAEPSSTSLPQQWDKPRGPKIQAEPVSQIVIARPGNVNRKRKPVMAMYNDNRSVELDESDITLLKNLSSTPISYLVSEPNQMIDAGQSQQPLGSGLSYHAPLITPLKQPRPDGADICGQIDFPKPYMMLNLESAKICEMQPHWQELYTSFEKCAEIERSTKDQNNSAIWFAERKCRITASNFGPVINRKKEINDTFIKNTFDKKMFKSAPTSYGQSNEKTAKQMYIKSSGNHIHDVGLVVNPLFPFLGASPDAKVCEKSVTGILEIKCPYSVRDCTLKEACEEQTNFFLEISGSNYTLKRSHSHWFQVQGQLLVTGAPFCDFVTYTRQEISVERIYIHALILCFHC